jgi:hypothetical protein
MADTPEQKKQREADEAARKQVLPAPTSEQVQSKVPNMTVGQQTRGPGGVRLDQQTAPAGKELIGMRSGVPIYADANDVYGNAAPASPTPQPATAPAATAPTATRTQQTPTQQSTTAPAAATSTAAAAPSPSVQQMRDTYQTSQTATATRAQQAPRTNPYEPVNRGGFFSKEYAQQFKTAQAAANQRAIDRIGAPRQDLATSTTATSNAAASALRSAAAQPTVASAEQVRAAGFGPERTKRLLFGVGDKGESVNVTPDYLKRLRDRSIRKY